jgi:hypothetical protein
MKINNLIFILLIFHLFVYCIYFFKTKQQNSTYAIFGFVRYIYNNKRVNVLNSILYCDI